MAKKKRARPLSKSPSPDRAVNLKPSFAHGGDDHTSRPFAEGSAIPAEVVRGDWTVALLALMMFVAPAIGVPYEELLQDTLKSMVVAFAAVTSGLLFAWRQRHRHDGLRWHGLMYLPLALMLYALGSMVWSHTYLGGVEAVRWFIFSLLLWLGLNTLSRERTPQLIEAIHWGAVVACLWAALQFWFNLNYFPQGPNPASTFVNRNFLAEFVVCTLPFSAYLLAQAKSSSRVVVLAFTLGFNGVALMMTGTRGALGALWLCLLVFLPVIATLYRRQFAFFKWHKGRRVLALGVLLATVCGLGLMGTGNPKLQADAITYGTTAFDRAFNRTASISPSDTSLNIRFVMWSATGRMVQAHPLAGVGAGAWEAVVPLYQSEGSQLETDYYVHNEILQLLAEYGLTGLVFLLALAAYLLTAAWHTVRNRTEQGLAEAPLRATILTSLLAFMIVSNIGFPWRLAATGSLFALSLALLAASDARLQNPGLLQAMRLNWKPLYSRCLMWVMAGCLALTFYISQQAVAVERQIISAAKIALGISSSADTNNPKWDPLKRQMLALVKSSIAINPHYRKITPMVADELGRWGDWKNAVWVWESVVDSRPHVVGILSNIARGYSQIGDNDKALEYLARCEKLQPHAVSVLSLKVVLLGRAGQEPQALQLAKQYMKTHTYDLDLLNTAYVLGIRHHDTDMVLDSLRLKQKSFPTDAVDTWLKLGSAHANLRNDDTNALASYRAALAASPADTKDKVLQQIPAIYLSRL